jgi:hypothetical protein
MLTIVVPPGAIPGHEASAAASLNRDLLILERLLRVRDESLEDGFEADEVIVPNVRNAE